MCACLCVCASLYEKECVNERGRDKASVFEPDSLISNGLIIVRALLLLSLKNRKPISCIIITPTGMCVREHHYV